MKRAHMAADPGSFGDTTLRAAVVTVGLDDRLAGEGPYYQVNPQVDASSQGTGEPSRRR